CSISKYKREELIGQNHRIIRSEYHDQVFFQKLWASISSGKVWRGEIKNKAKDSSLYWVDTTIVPFLDEKGKPYQYLSVRFDITERKKIEENMLFKTGLLSAIAEVISTLFQYDDWEVALERCLGIVGEAVSVDRVYYFENFFDPKTGEGFSSQRLEWTKITACSQIHNSALKMLPFDKHADFYGLLGKNKPFKAIVSQMKNGRTKNM